MYQEPVCYMAGTNGWCTEEVMKRVITRLWLWRRRHCQHRRLVLVFDAMSAHVTRDVLAYAARRQILVLLIPGSCTWLLQPLDVYVFQVLKSDLRQRIVEYKSRTDDGMLQPLDWIALMHDSVHQVLVNQTWEHCFSKLGLSSEHSNVTNHLKAFLPPPEMIESRPLTDEEVDCILGRHRVDLTTVLFSAAHLTLARRQALADAPAEHPVALESLDSGVVSAASED